MTQEPLRKRVDETGALPPICIYPKKLSPSVPLHITRLFCFIFVRVMYTQLLDRADLSSKEEPKSPLKV